MTPPLVGDHPALDLMNTVAVVDGAVVDFWQSDGDVVDWLAGRGLLPSGVQMPQDLLAEARGLREVVRALVEHRKRGEPLALEPLNEFLLGAASYPRLGPGPNLERHFQHMLGPVAEAAAELIANGDFSLIRRCENPQCVLWFYDRTKAHVRRWCSMAACGNRHKVTAYRGRKRRMPKS